MKIKTHLSSHSILFTSLLQFLLSYPLFLTTVRLCIYNRIQHTQHNTTPYNTIQYNTIQYDETTQYNTTEDKTR